jgi:hypothetical protein
MMPPLPPLPLGVDGVEGVEGVDAAGVDGAALGTEPRPGSEAAECVTAALIEAAGRARGLTWDADDPDDDPECVITKATPNAAAASNATRAPRRAVTGSACAACATLA